jgi:hypothetical protein
MSKPRFGPHVNLTIERRDETVCVTLSQDSALPDGLRLSEYAASEGLALRKLAQIAVAARLTDQWAMTANELLERMSEADRARFAPHLRQSAQDIAEMMSATVGRIDALMAVTGELREPNLSERLAAHMASQPINVERECLQDARSALACADDQMTREQFVTLFQNLRRVLGVS